MRRNLRINNNSLKKKRDENLEVLIYQLEAKCVDKLVEKNLQS